MDTSDDKYLLPSSMVTRRLNGLFKTVVAKLGSRLELSILGFDGPRILGPDGNPICHEPEAQFVGNPLAIPTKE